MAATASSIGISKVSVLLNMNIHYLHLTDSLGAIEGKLVKCALWLINLVHSQSIMQFILSFFLHGIILSHQIEKVRQKVMKLIWQSHVQRVKLIPYDLYFVWIIVNDLQMLQKIMISFLMQKECDVLTDTSHIDWSPRPVSSEGYQNDHYWLSTSV